jgi:hypothetical protein
MNDFPPEKNCSFCDAVVSLSDRRKTGIRIIIAAFCVGGATGWYFGGVVGVMDGLILFAWGLAMMLRKERYVYRCLKCTNVMSPYDPE